MSIPTSEYRIPIFISSTDYNLKDLRAELSQYLDSLGYRPILSSAEGFPDSSPTLEPWESCLEVLGTCPIMILIIDNRYGEKLEWKNFKKIIKDEVAPTHGEYLFSHYHNKRLLVFIRDEILVYYQSYRAIKKNTDNENELREALMAGIPKSTGIDYGIFPFIESVKTTKPIPWIKGFKDVTDLKREVHKKLLNELGVVFLIKERHTEIVTSALSRILEESSEDKRMEILSQIGYTRDIIEKFESQNKKVNILTEENNKLLSQATEYKQELEIANKEAIKDGKRIEELTQNLNTIRKRLEKNTVDLSSLREDNVNHLLDSNLFRYETDDLIKLPKHFRSSSYYTNPLDFLKIFQYKLGTTVKDKSEKKVEIPTKEVGDVPSDEESKKVEKSNEPILKKNEKPRINFEDES